MTTELPAHVAVGNWLDSYRRQAIAADLIAAALGGAIGYLVRFGGAEVSSPSYVAASCALPLAWLLAVFLNGGYEAKLIGAGGLEFQRVMSAWIKLVAAIAIVGYAVKVDIARGFVVVALPVSLVCALAFRYGARLHLHARRRSGHALTSVLLAGSPASIYGMVEQIAADKTAGLRVIGACVPAGSMGDGAEFELESLGVPVLGEIDSLGDIARRTGVDQVAVTSSAELGSSRMRWIAWQLEGTATDLLVAPGLVDTAGTRLHIMPMAGVPMLHIEQPRFSGISRVLKSAMDRLTATGALFLLTPLLAAVALAVRLDSKGPALFVQNRVGKDGRSFRIVKFRSMYIDAEARRGELEGLNEHGAGATLFKIKDDPRVTRVGRLLRKTSLDELPQLFNVVAGSMSLVGPRPPLPAEVATYEDDARRRLLVKPGITGLWQISGRSDLSWAESVRLDLIYVENWTPALDISILIKTVWAVTRGSGAY